MIPTGRDFGLAEWIKNAQIPYSGVKIENIKPDTTYEQCIMYSEALLWH